MSNDEQPNYWDAAEWRKRNADAINAEFSLYQRTLIRREQRQRRIKAWLWFTVKVVWTLVFLALAYWYSGLDAVLFGLALGNMPPGWSHQDDIDAGIEEVQHERGCPHGHSRQWKTVGLYLYCIIQYPDDNDDDVEIARFNSVDDCEQAAELFQETWDSVDHDCICADIRADRMADSVD